MRWLKTGFVALPMMFCAAVGACAQTPDVAFWQWFAANEVALRTAEPNHPLARQVAGELRRVHPGLAYEFGTAPDGRRQFVVSADGQAALFPVVLRLVRQSPEMEHWQVVAFRPRIGTSYGIKTDRVTLRPEQIWFRAQREETGRVRLAVYVQGYADQLEADVRGALEVLLQAALGEYDATTRLGAVVFYPLPGDPHKAGLTPFQQLPATVDSLRPASTINAR